MHKNLRGSMRHREILKRSIREGKNPGARRKIERKRSREHGKIKRSKEKHLQGGKDRKLKRARNEGANHEANQEHRGP